MPYTNAQAILSAQAAAGRSAAVNMGNLPGRSFNLTTAGFSGTVTPQISGDGGTTWVNCQYVDSNGVPKSGALSYTTDTAVYQFWVLNPNDLFSLSVTRSAGSVSSTYFGSDTAEALPTPVGTVAQGAPAAASTPWPAAPAASAAGGATVSAKRNVVGTVLAVKASAGTLYGVLVTNTTGATAWVQLFNAATADVTLGTTTPDLEFQVATVTQQYFPLPAVGVNFGTAISVASTTLEKGSVASASGVHVTALYA